MSLTTREFIPDFNPFILHTSVRMQDGRTALELCCVAFLDETTFIRAPVRESGSNSSSIFTACFVFMVQACRVSARCACVYHEEAEPGARKKHSLMV